MNCCPFCKKEAFPLLYIPEYPVFASAVGGPEHEDIFYDFAVYFCEDCALGFQANPPDTQKLSTRVRVPNSVSKVWQNHYRALFSFALAGRDKENCKALDIGAGHGFLSKLLLEEGIAVEAVEKNPGDNLLQLGIPLYREFFGPKAGVRKKYDLVFVSHVLSHVNDLEDFLQNAAGVVAPGGDLIFSVSDIVAGMQENDLSIFIPDHTWYFSERSMEILCARAGFAVTKIGFFPGHSIFVKARREAHRGDWKERKALSRLGEIWQGYIAAYDKTVAKVSALIRGEPERVVFFGAHSMVLNLVLPLKPWQNTQCRFALIDNDPQKQGLRLSGTPWRILPPKQAELVSSDIVCIPISPYAGEMREQVLNLAPKARIEIL